MMRCVRPWVLYEADATRARWIEKQRRMADLEENLLAAARQEAARGTD